jgi:hypothetical protein
VNRTIATGSDDDIRSVFSRLPRELQQMLGVAAFADFELSLGATENIERPVEAAARFPSARSGVE